MGAKPEDLHAIHAKIAKAYLSLLDKMLESDEPVNPAVLNAINKFLKDNNIEALPVAESPLAKLQGRLHLIKDYMADHEKLAAGE